MIVGGIADLDELKLDKGKHKIDILENNTSVELVKHPSITTPDDFESIYSLNVRVTLLMTEAVLPNLPEQGRIINISSVGARCSPVRLLIAPAKQPLKVSLDVELPSWVRMEPLSIV
jgi:NAD(P)-dependent dehydrogenase (short-subunit alcohol dehydrogenase family)